VIGAVNRAELFKGKALLGKGDFAGAKSQFEKTIGMAKDEAGAEAKYRIGEIQYKQKDYDGSIKTMQQLANDFSDYLTWYENAFMLIADNYVGKGDSFMAKATLNSIIENSSNKETVALAKQKLNSIK
jgi:TolA-binding protein